MEKVAQRIKELIDDQGLSNGEFAKRTNLNPAIISHILSGRNNPSLSVIQSIKDEFTDVNLDYLLNGQGVIYNSKEEGSKDISADADPEFTTVNPMPSPMAEPANTAQEAEHEKEPERLVKPSPPEFEKPQEKDEDVYKSKLHGAVDPREIEQIVIFYSDGSFKAYRP